MLVTWRQTQRSQPRTPIEGRTGSAPLAARAVELSDAGTSGPVAGRVVPWPSAPLSVANASWIPSGR